MAPRIDVERAREVDDADVPVAYVDRFAASMPTRYRVLFDPRAIRRHAAVAYRRGARVAHVEVWRALPDGSAALCIVADDRPGLLALVAAALVSHRLTVITAHVFSRVAASGSAEALDLFWVRRADSADGSPVEAAEAASVAQVLGALLAGTIAIADIATRPGAPPHEPGVVIHFEDADDDGLAILDVEANDRPGLLLAITGVLSGEGVQIVRSIVRTVGGRAHNRFELTEADGAPVLAERRARIVLALEPVLDVRAES
jgi:[protein-PII] uridylyltransferase